jgi:hypothetical protein
MSEQVKKIIKENGVILKYQGVAPEGFILVHEKTLEQLTNMKTWIDWRMGRISINDMNKLNLKDT